MVFEATKNVSFCIVNKKTSEFFFFFFFIDVANFSIIWIFAQKMTKIHKSV